MGVKLHVVEPGVLVFHCPGCQCSHQVNVDPRRGHPLWIWNTSLERPTFSPSLLHPAAPRCHAFVREGSIEFLADCAHPLAGQTVELPDWED